MILGFKRQPTQPTQFTLRVSLGHRTDVLKYLLKKYLQILVKTDIPASGHPRRRVGWAVPVSEILTEKASLFAIPAAVTIPGVWLGTTTPVPCPLPIRVAPALKVSSVAQGEVSVNVPEHAIRPLEVHTVRL